MQIRLKKTHRGLKLPLNKIKNKTKMKKLIYKKQKQAILAVQKLGEKNENSRCCEELCVNTQAQKFLKIFENIYILITFVQPEHFLNCF